VQQEIGFGEPAGEHATFKKKTVKKYRGGHEEGDSIDLEVQRLGYSVH